LRRRRPTPGAQRLKRPISIGAEPTADGRHACRMNSASGGLRPTVGLRRPGKGSLRRRRPTPGAQRLERPIQSAQNGRHAPNEFGLRRPTADGRPAPTGKILRVGGGRRLARQRLKRPISIGAEPSADGWPARRMNSASGGLRPTVGLRRPGKGVLCVGGGRRLARQRLEEADSIGAEPSAGGRPARRMNSASGRPTVGLRRPGKSFASAEADAWRAAPEEADFNRRRAFGRRSACVPNEFGLRRPAADGRPAPTGKTLRVGAGRRLARSA
jgi:hypothetical protein